MNAPTGGAGREPADAGALSAGRVGRAHGLDGSFYVTRPVARLLQEGTVVSVRGRRAEIVRRAGTDAHPIVRVDGVGSRAAAEELRGSELSVAREHAPALADGEWWAHELEGCEVLADGHLLGIVTRMLELPSCEALEVGGVPGTPLLIVPMVRDAVREIDVRQGRIEVDGAFLGVEPPAEGGA